jgi:hypothetical protein
LNIWTGPSADSKGYYVQASCQVDQVAIPTNSNTGTNKKLSDNSSIAEIRCEPKSKFSFVRGTPPAKS